MNMLITLAFIIGSISFPIKCKNPTPVKVDKKICISEAKTASHVYTKDKGVDTLHYDGENDNNAVGLTAGGTFYAGVRFTPSADDTLRSIIFFHSDKVSQSGTIYIYGPGTDTTYGTELTNQDFTTVVDSSWERINLVSPIAVTSGTDFWAVIKFTHGAGEFPIGIDAGPMVVNRGGFISLDAIEWSQLTVAAGADVNFNIRAILGDPVAVEEKESNSKGFKISCSANPVNTRGSISYTVPNKMNVNIKLFDITGKLVQTLESRTLEKGTYEKTVNVGTGAYFCYVQAGNYKTTKKLIFVK